MTSNTHMAQQFDTILFEVAFEYQSVPIGASLVGTVLITAWLPQLVAAMLGLSPLAWKPTNCALFTVWTIASLARA
jgi:hypothetical protein